MKLTDEELMAYADGELDPEAHARVDALIASDPEVARAVERHRAMAARVRGAYEDVSREPVPERLSALLARGAASPVADLSSRRPGRDDRLRASRLPPWAALAASIGVVMLVGVFLLREPAAPYERIEGTLVARGALDEALTTELASLPGQGDVAIGISFRDRAGTYCRTFSLQRDSPKAGLACRRGTEWELRVLADAPASPGEVRAAAAMPLPVLQAVDAAIDGEPLNAAAEAAARDAGWRSDRNVAE